MKTTLMSVAAILIAGCLQGSAGNGPTAALPARAAPASEQQRDVTPASTNAPPAVAQVAADRNEPVEFGSAMAKAHPDQAKAMLAAAEKTWEATKASYEVGTTTLAHVHHWSQQLLLAERALADTQEQDLAALLAYWKRTKSTYLKVRALYITGTRGGETEKFGAASFYLAESELWLLEAGGTIPDNTD